ncbi:MAG: hypothetical protein J5501_00260 [Ruminococcus sp.]|nr:hypothetical protein [Ruminococcus sp.]
MRLSELKYIGQKELDECHIDVRSADMFREAQDFNAHMLEMRRRKWKFRKDLIAMGALNLILIPISLSKPDSQLSLLRHFTDRNATAVLSLLFTLAYIVLFCFFFIHKKDYSPVKCLLYSLFLIPASILNIVAVVFNTILMFFMKKTDDEIKDEPGYPSFPQLHISCPVDLDALEPGDMEDSRGAEKSDDLEHTEESAETDPYAKYRIKPEDDEGLLRDSDISFDMNGTEDTSNG